MRTSERSDEANPARRAWVGKALTALDLRQEDAVPWARWALFGILIYFCYMVYRDSNPFTGNISDFGPAPDSVEYLLLGERIAWAGRLTLDVNGVDWATRYPPLMSFILVPFFYLLTTPERVASIAPVVIGCLAITLACKTLERIAGTVAGLVFGLLLASSPLMLKTSWDILTEPSTVVIIAALGMTLARGLKTKLTRWDCMLVGALCGALTILKLQSVFIVGALALAALVCYRAAATRLIARSMWSFFCVAALGLAYNYAVFGNPLYTGYQWQLGASDFSVKNIPKNLTFLQALVLGQPVEIVGIRAPGLPLGMPILAFGGLLCLYRGYGRRATVAVVLSATFMTLPMFLYGFIDFRINLTLMLIVCGLASIFFGAAVYPGISRIVPPVVALVGVLSLAFFWPGFGETSGYAFYKKWHDRRWRSDKYILAQTLRFDVERRGGGATSFVSNVYLPLAARWVGNIAKVYPLGSPQCYGACSQWAKSAFRYDIGELVNTSHVYITDIDTNRQKFLELCTSLASRFSIEKVSGPGVWRLFIIGQQKNEQGASACM